MSKPAPTAHLLSRRIALKTLASTCAGGFAITSLPAWCQTSGIASKTNFQDIWRALSRVGYGPTPDLIFAARSGNGPRAWALGQIDAAYAASQLAPKIAPDLADFNAALPSLVEGSRQEREARKQRKANPAQDGDSPQLRRMDFSGASDPIHFSRKVVQQASAWRLLSASQPAMENPLLARMAEFWFNHLNVYVGKGSVRPFVGHYWVNVARKHALGRFEDLLLASARHPAMLAYLDQAQSVADGFKGAQGKTRGLNENYARELMELHTLGVNGGYTQSDVHELARVLTGWTIGPREETGFRFVARLHDAGNKEVLGQRFPRHRGAAGEQEGVDAIRMLARHPSTAKRVCLRLAQYFVSDEPSAALLERLQSTFLSTQGDLRIVMQTLFDSSDFWSSDQKLFKTPWDYAASVLTVTHATSADSEETPNRRTLVQATAFLASAGQPIFGWQTPDGYKFDAATWLVPEALTRRADFALAVARNTPKPDFLNEFLGTATHDAVNREPTGMQAGLMLASPEFMAK